MLKVEGGSSSNGVTTDTTQTISGQKKFSGAVEFTGDATALTTSAAGCQPGTASGFGGLWILQNGQTPSTSNYVLLNAGDYLVNTPTGTTLRLRVANGNVLSLDASTATFAAGVKAVFDATDSTGSPGNATINKPAGKSAIANTGTTCVVTNSLVSSSSLVIVTPMDIDGTKVFKAVPASGSFTVTLSSAATATWKFAWWVIN